MTQRAVDYLINIYIYQNKKDSYNKYLLFKAYTGLKSWLIVSKGQ